MSWAIGPYVMCATCGDRRPPITTHERWDAADQIVVGRLTCVKCGARSLFTRYLTTAEAQAEQTQGEPIRSRYDQP